MVGVVGKKNHKRDHAEGAGNFLTFFFTFVVKFPVRSSRVVGIPGSGFPASFASGRKV